MKNLTILIYVSVLVGMSSCLVHGQENEEDINGKWFVHKDKW